MERTYLSAAFQRLKRWIPMAPEEMLQVLADREQAGKKEYLVERQGRLTYCLFCWPLLYADGTKAYAGWGKEPVLMQNAVLVFDDSMQILADQAVLSFRVKDFLLREDLYDALTLDNDWNYLAYYTLHGIMFEQLPFPFCLEPMEEQEALWKTNRGLFDGLVLMHTNSYVTRCVRRQGIFKAMLQKMQDFALRGEEGDSVLYDTFSLDPDVACYGPDTVKEPYHYSFEKDEPDRMRNGEILRKQGYAVLRLEEEDPSMESDGTKLWFAVRKQRIIDLA